MLTQRMASKTEFFEGLFSADDEVVDDNVDEWALLHQSFHGKPDISDHEAQDPVQTPSLVVHSPDGPVIDQTASERPRTASAKEFKMPKNPPAIPKSEEVPEIEVVPGPKANASFSAKGQPKRQAKRKRTDSVTLAPELGRAFAGKVLYFFPNNEINPARKLRIRRAVEYGATWAKDWTKSVTHIIVDKDLEMKDVLKHLKMDSIPDGIILVNEIYTPACIIFRRLLSPNQSRFKVKGYDEPQLPKIPPKPQTPISPARPLALRHSSLDLSPATTLRSSQTTEIGAGREIDDVARRSLFKQLEKEETVEKRDALDEVIDSVKQLQGVPIDETDDDKGHSGGDSSSESDGKETRKKSGTRGDSKDSWKNSFSCMKAPAATKDKGPNATTIEILQKMASYYENTGDHWRLYSYRRAIASLRSHPKKVTTKAEARALPCIGDSLAEKIEEIRFTNRLQKLENISDAPTDKAIELFMGVYGAGYKQASTWVAQGHRTLEDLSNFSKLTKNQRVGVERYKDFNSRIPREEVDDHAKFVRGHMAHISPALSLTIGGSYRRGKQTCGDIDFLITGKNLFPETLRNLVLRDLVGRLTAFSYIQCSLSVSSSSDGRIWHGAASLPQHFPRIWRRVDFLVVPEEEWGAALIYFTGDDIFNRSVRLLASRMGYRLNQQGLFKDVMRGPQRVKVTEGTLVEARSEKKIFEVLGVPWRAPEDRNFG